MRRRDFIKGIVGAATAWPFATHAQQAAEMRRVAYLSASAETDSESQRVFAAFLQELRGLGWIEGSNMRIADEVHARCQPEDRQDTRRDCATVVARERR